MLKKLLIFIVVNWCLPQKISRYWKWVCAWELSLILGNFKIFKDPKISPRQTTLLFSTSYPIRYLKSELFLKNNPACELLLKNTDYNKYQVKDYDSCTASECSFYNDLTIQVVTWNLGQDECGFEEYEDPYLRIRGFRNLEDRLENGIML